MNDKTQLVSFAYDRHNARYGDYASTRIQIHFTELAKYLHRWKLKLNVEKSQLINGNKKGANRKFAIVKINNIPITEVTFVEYLGVTPDKN